ncbi:MAG TPA: hydrogenase maturation protease [Chthonomonadales bacterium]|nr:hydrogenase maturation protease [Chthonomonadales bacterium]
MTPCDGASGGPGAPRASGTCVVIGYGNELRSDDGAGPWVARAVAALALPGVLATDAHQLVPEMAEMLSDARLAVFVDATVTPEPTDVAARRVEPHADPAGASHFGDPGALLWITRQVYGRCPEAWLVTIPARNLDLGESLTPGVRALCDTAVSVVARLVACP